MLQGTCRQLIKVMDSSLESLAQMAIELKETPSEALSQLRVSIFCAVKAFFVLLRGYSSFILLLCCLFVEAHLTGEPDSDVP